MKTLVGGNTYLKNNVIAMYKSRGDNYICCQQVAEKDGLPVDKYIEFNGCCLAVVEEGYIVVKAIKNLSTDNVNVTIYKIDDVDDVTKAKNTVYYKSELMFSGCIEEFERRRTMKGYEKVVQFTVNNLYCLVPAYYINE